jgi:hypothetical protein
MTFQSSSTPLLFSSSPDLVAPAKKPKRGPRRRGPWSLVMTEEMVREGRRLRKGGMTYGDIGKQLGAKTNTVRSALNRKLRRQVEDEPAPTSAPARASLKRPAHSKKHLVPAELEAIWRFHFDGKGRLQIVGLTERDLNTVDRVLDFEGKIADASRRARQKVERERGAVAPAPVPLPVAPPAPPPAKKEKLRAPAPVAPPVAVTNGCLIALTPEQFSALLELGRPRR